ncbi:MAG: NADPH-dependent glutamate synthase, partial [Methanoregulaceae archaeon]|nr:NADPH-dependent glutamate synthase [Methanoregulaceae archaeon]
VDTGLSEEEAINEAERCLQCKKPACVTGCPVGIDIPAFVSAVAEGNFAGAAGIIREENMLPAVCGRVCPQEQQCEGTCTLGVKEQPVSIGTLERFVADWERLHGVVLPACLPDSGFRVAVVGSGPAGLTGAAELARLGHRVTVFESLHETGGVLMYGIPSFRLPKEVVRAETGRVAAMGVRFFTNHLAGASLPVEDLLEFDAVLLATGAGLPHFMGIPGEQLNGVYSANEYLTRVNLMHADLFPDWDTPVKRGSRVVVAGGGNVAMDAARVARRLGARVTLVYRRREEDLPARKAEVGSAKEEGITFCLEANPVRIAGERAVTGVECIRLAMGESDESGRPSFMPIPGSNFMIDADLFIEAIGQAPNPLMTRFFPGIATGRHGNLATDEEGRTSIPRVFAAGDIATGAATVILAMGGAKTAARVIDRDLRNRKSD